MISLDWYYEHLLEENELSALLDGLYFSSRELWIY